MKCPFCNYADSKVVDSRPTDEGTSIRRRRECLQCGKRFTTYETIERLPLMLVKRDGTREPYDRNKLLAGVMKACEKRPVSQTVLEQLVDTVEQKLFGTLEYEVSSKMIGEMVMEELREIDEVSYVRFASVYRQFKDINTFLDELNSLLKEKNQA
ncbi:MAG: transcriptional regulator NrdR [Butyricicoccus sp.]